MVACCTVCLGHYSVNHHTWIPIRMPFLGRRKPVDINALRKASSALAPKQATCRKTRPRLGPRNKHIAIGGKSTPVRHSTSHSIEKTKVSKGRVRGTEVFRKLLRYRNAIHSQRITGSWNFHRQRPKLFSLWYYIFLSNGKKEEKKKKEKKTPLQTHVVSLPPPWKPFHISVTDQRHVTEAMKTLAPKRKRAVRTDTIAPFSSIILQKNTVTFWKYPPNRRCQLPGTQEKRPPKVTRSKPTQCCFEKQCNRTWCTSCLCKISTYLCWFLIKTYMKSTRVCNRLSKNNVDCEGNGLDNDWFFIWKKGAGKY